MISKVKPLSHLFFTWPNGDILKKADQLFLSVGTLFPSSAAPMLPPGNWKMAALLEKCSQKNPDGMGAYTIEFIAKETG